MISIRLSNSEDTRYIDVYPLEDMTLPLPAINENLQHQELSCSFKTEYDPDAFEYIMTYDVLNAVVYDGITPVFTGRIKNEITWADNGYPLPMDSIALTIEDNTYLFNQKSEDEFAQINQSLDAIIRDLCSECGVSVAESAELRETVVQAFVLDSNKTYSTAFNNLLFQYGYAYFFNGAGEVDFIDLFSVPELKQALTDKDFYTGVEIKRSTKNYTGVRLKYNTLTKKENEQVYFEGNGLNEDSKVTPIIVRPGQYYPYDSDPIQEEREGQIYQTFEDGYAESYQTYSGETKYRRTQKTSLVYTENHYVVPDWVGTLVIDRTQFGARKASVRFLNTGRVDSNLYQLAIRADAYYRNQEVSVSAGDLKDPYEYESEYIYGAASADNFIEFLSRFYMGSNFKLTGRLSFALEVGKHVSVDTGLSGFTCNAIVLGCEKDCKNNIYKITLLQYGQAAFITQRYKTYASNYGKFSEQQVFPRSISSIVEEYYLSTSAVAVQGGSWQTTAPAWEQGKYIWTRTRINYNSGDSYVTDPLRSTALDNVGVDSVDIEYAQTDNAIDAPEEGWSTTAPQWQQGMFVWSRTKTILTDGSILYSNPACITGAKGEMGTAIKYLGLFDHLPENANEGEFILAKSDFTSSENLQLINGNKLKLISGNYLSLLRSYTAGYIYVKSSKDYWWRVDDKNDYRYLLASNDLLEMGWNLSTNLQVELNNIEERSQNYTDTEIESLSQEVDVKVQNGPHYVGPADTAPESANIGDWYLNTTSGTIFKKNDEEWGEVTEYTPETAYMYSAAAKDALGFAASQGNVGKFALAYISELVANEAFIEKLSAKIIKLSQDAEGNAGTIYGGNRYKADGTDDDLTAKGFYMSTDGQIKANEAIFYDAEMAGSILSTDAFLPTLEMEMYNEQGVTDIVINMTEMTVPQIKSKLDAIIDSPASGACRIDWQNQDAKKVYIQIVSEDAYNPIPACREGWQLLRRYNDQQQLVYTIAGQALYRDVLLNNTKIFTAQYAGQTVRCSSKLHFKMYTRYTNLHCNELWATNMIGSFLGYQFNALEKDYFAERRSFAYGHNNYDLYPLFKKLGIRQEPRMCAIKTTDGVWHTAIVYKNGDNYIINYEGNKITISDNQSTAQLFLQISF